LYLSKISQNYFFVEQYYISSISDLNKLLNFTKTIYQFTPSPSSDQILPYVFHIYNHERFFASLVLTGLLKHAIADYYSHDNVEIMFLDRPFLRHVTVLLQSFV